MPAWGCAPRVGPRGLLPSAGVHRFPAIDPLARFVYRILRDHLPAGTVERAAEMAAAEGAVEASEELGALAERLAGLLRETSEEVAAAAAPEPPPALLDPPPATTELRPIPDGARTARAAVVYVFDNNPGVWAKLPAIHLAAGGLEAHTYNSIRQAVQALVRDGHLEAKGATAARVYRRVETSEPDHDGAGEGVTPADPADDAERGDHDDERDADALASSVAREHRGSGDDVGESGAPAATTAGGASGGAAEMPPVAAPDREPTDEEVILSVQRAGTPVSAYEMSVRLNTDEEKLVETLDRLADAGELTREENVEAQGPFYSFGTGTDKIEKDAGQKPEGEAAGGKTEKPLVDRVGDFIDAAASETERFQNGEVFPVEVEREFSLQRVKLLEVMASLQQEGRVVVLAPRSQYTRYRSARVKRGGSPRRHARGDESAEPVGAGIVNLRDSAAECNAEAKGEQEAAEAAAIAVLPSVCEWARAAGAFSPRRLREVFDLDPLAAGRVVAILSQESAIQRVGDARTDTWEATASLRSRARDGCGPTSRLPLNSGGDGSTLEARALGVCGGGGATLATVCSSLGVSEKVAQKVLSYLFKEGEVRPRSKGGDIHYVAVL